MNQQTTPRILVVDSNLASQKLLGMVLQDAGLTYVTASTVKQALAFVHAELPHLVILDPTSPPDGLEFCKMLRRDPLAGHLPILIASARDYTEDKIAAFEAGADDFLCKPFDPRELTLRVKGLLAKSFTPPPASSPVIQAGGGQVVAVYGAKGGVGKTTLAVNIALAFQQRSRKKTVLLDADLLLPNVGVQMNLNSTRNIATLRGYFPRLDADLLRQALVRHASGLQVLLGPALMEEADSIETGDLKSLLAALRVQFEFTVVDCPSTLDDRTFTILHAADCVLLVVTPELGVLRNTQSFFELAKKLNVPLSKFRMVLNRVDSNVGIKPEQIERTLGMPASFFVSSDGRIMVACGNMGNPIVLERPNHAISKQILDMANKLQVYPVPAAA